MFPDLFNLDVRSLISLGYRTISLNQFNGIFINLIVFNISVIKTSNVTDSKSVHYNPVQTHSKSESRYFFRINFKVSKNIGMNHSGPKHFYPTPAFANCAAFATTELTF